MASYRKRVEEEEEAPRRKETAMEGKGKVAVPSRMFFFCKSIVGISELRGEGGITHVALHRQWVLLRGLLLPHADVYLPRRRRSGLGGGRHASFSLSFRRSTRDLLGYNKRRGTLPSLYDVYCRRPTKEEDSMTHTSGAGFVRFCCLWRRGCAFPLHTQRDALNCAWSWKRSFFFFLFPSFYSATARQRALSK
jgi:hypothetical protein